MIPGSGKRRAAIRKLGAALERHADNNDLLARLGVLLLDEGRHDNALDDRRAVESLVELALGLDPEHACAWEELGKHRYPLAIRINEREPVPTAHLGEARGPRLRACPSRTCG